MVLVLSHVHRIMPLELLRARRRREVERVIDDAEPERCRVAPAHGESRPPRRIDRPSARPANVEASDYAVHSEECKAGHPEDERGGTQDGERDCAREAAALDVMSHCYVLAAFAENLSAPVDTTPSANQSAGLRERRSRLSSASRWRRRATSRLASRRA